MSRRWVGLFTLGVAAGDLVFLHLGFIGAFILRFGGFPEENFQAYLVAAPGLTVIAVVFFLVYGLYDLRPQSWRSTASGLIVALALFVGAGMGLSFLVRALALPRTVLALAWVLDLVLLLLWRSLVWQAARRVWGLERTVVVGPLSEALEYVGKVEGGRGRPAFEVTAVVTGPEAEDQPLWWPAVETAEATGEVAAGVATAARREGTRPGVGPIPVFPLEALPSLLGGKETCPDLILVTPSTAPDDKARVIAVASVTPTRVLLVPGYRDLLVLDTRMDQIDNTLVLQVGPAGIPPRLAWVKRVADIAGALAGLALTLPFYPVLALAVRLSSPGPVFYRQARVGARGRPYTLWKFRTMRHDAEAATGPALSQRDDPRVTSVGRFLRRYRLDELPQMLNVLTGSMSVVGPRPERPEFAREFAKAVPYYEQRQLLKPGLTGLAQLAGRYDLPAHEKLRYDLLYAKRYSLLLDLRILLLTAKVLLLGEEAHWGADGEA
jgi:lipopolysaccharide/colanic/teichoic acid biosynthesis glycosyltransferase